MHLVGFIFHIGPKRFIKAKPVMNKEEQSGGLRTSTDNTMAAFTAAILEGDRCMACDETAMQSGIPKSSIHFVLTEALEKIMVTVHSMTTQDFILQKLKRVFSLITSGKQWLFPLIVLVFSSSQSSKTHCVDNEFSL